VARKTALSAPLQTASPNAPKPAHVQASLEMARPGLEPGTPRFSGTRQRHRKAPKSPANRRVAGRARRVQIPVVAGSFPRLKDVAPAPRPFRPHPRRRSCRRRLCPYASPESSFRTLRRRRPRYTPPRRATPRGAQPPVDGRFSAMNLPTEERSQPSKPSKRQPSWRASSPMAFSAIARSSSPRVKSV
jgi:hypothetical protein